MSIHHHLSSNSYLPYQTTALLFDLDDTLFDREKAFHRWATSFVQTYISFEKQHASQEAIDLLVSLDAHGRTPREHLFREFRRVYHSWHQASVEVFVEMFYQQFPQYVELEADVSVFLHTLQKTHIPFGIVTNASPRQQQKIEALGLDQLTSCIFISGLFGAKKPDASIFLAAASCLHVQAERVLFIGDNPMLDIWGAHQVGMRTVWLRRFAEWPPALEKDIADMTVDSLEELIAFLGYPP